MAVEVSSPAFEPDGAIPAKRTGEEQDISPPLEWSELSEGTKEVALFCDDPGAPADRPFVYWVVVQDCRLPEGIARRRCERSSRG
jgi:phosphatidylethanolamine-binding protein (PEBP) family uncharacterized protein